MAKKEETNTFEVLKDWGSYKKGDSIVLKDSTVIDKAKELKVIK